MFTTLFAKRVGLSFLRAFVPFLLLGLVGAWDSFVVGDLEAGKAAVIALITGAVTAGLRAIQVLTTDFETDPRLK